MRVKDVVSALRAEVVTREQGLEKEITGVYVCDLLSWVMSRAGKGNAWITVLTNINVVAVAVLTEVSCIIIPEGIKVEQTTIDRANTEGIVIIGTELTGYEVCSALCDLVKGN